MITGGVGSSFYEHLKKYRNIQENNIDEERSYISDLPTGLQRTLDEPRTAFMWVDYVVENMEGYGCLVSLYFSSIGFLVCMNIIYGSLIIGQLSANSLKCFLISMQLVPAWKSDSTFPSAPAISKKSPFKMFIGHGIRNLIEKGQFR